MIAFALVIGIEINGDVWESIPQVVDTLSECLTIEQQYTRDVVVWSGCYKADINNQGKIIKFY